MELTDITEQNHSPICDSRMWVITERAHVTFRNGHVLSLERSYVTACTCVLSAIAQTFICILNIYEMMAHVPFLCRLMYLGHQDPNCKQK